MEEIEIVIGDYDLGAYEPYKGQVQQLTHEPLRAVGDVKDRYVLIDGEWYIERNCAVYTVTGDERLLIYEGDYTWENIQYYITGLPNMIVDTTKPNGICDRYEFIKSNIRMMASSHNTVWCGNSHIGFLYDKNRPLSDSEARNLMKGMTVVYILATPTYEKISYNPLSVYKDMSHISTNSTIPCDMTIKNHGFNALLKPSTTYTVASSQGNQTIVTKSTLDDSLRLYGEGAIKNVRVLEGNVENIPSHFSGIESAFEQNYDESVGKYKIEVKTVGKNLYNIESWRDADIYKGTHVVQGNNIIITATGGDCYSNTGMDIAGKYIRDIRRQHIIPVKPNTTYTLSYNKTVGGQSNYYCLIDSDYYVTYHKGLTRITGDGGGTSVTQITTGNDTRFIGFRLGVMNEGETITYSNIQLEEGNTATAYESYKSNSLSFYLDEPLRGIGDVRDRVFVENGEVKVERRCTEVTFDGSEDYWYYSYTFPTTVRYRTNVGTYPKENNAISNNFMNVGTNSKAWTFVIGNTGNVEFIVPLSTVEDKNIDSWKQWLQANPTTVVYQLAQPTIETIDNASLSVNGFANAHMMFDTRIPLSKVEFKPFEEELKYLLPSKVYAVQFKSSANGNVDITLGSAKLSNQSVIQGSNKFKVTTPTTLVDNKLVINGIGMEIFEVVVCEYEASDFGYFEGLESVGKDNSIEIKSCNKNIIDDNLENWELLTKTPTYVFSNEGRTLSVTYTDGWNHGVILTTRLKKGTYYCGLSKTGNVDMYYNDGTTNDVNISNKTFTISNDTVVSFKLKNTSNIGGTYTVSDVYINEKTNLGYAPHQSNSQIMTHEPLRSVGNIRDKYVLQGREWFIERNCAEITVTGDNAELIYLNPNFATENYAVFNFKLPGYLQVCGVGTVLSANFKENQRTNTDERGLFCDHAYYGYGNIALFVHKSEIVPMDTYGAKAWLNANPQTFVYQLQAPVLEPINYNPLEVYSENCHISTDSVVPPTIRVETAGFECDIHPGTTYTLVYTIDGVKHQITMTTPHILKDNIIRLYGEGTLGNLVVLEGVGYNGVPEVVRGMESTFSQNLITDEEDINYGKYRAEFKVIGKNKFNKANMMFGKQLKLDTGEIVNNSAYDVTGYIPVSPNTTYIADNVKDGLLFTANKNRLNQIINTESNNVFTTPSNAHFVMFNLQKNVDDFDLTQIEVGNTLTDYQEYKESVLELFLDKPLNGVGNLSDRMFCSDGKMYLERKFDEFRISEDTKLDYLTQNTHGLYVYRISYDFEDSPTNYMYSNDLSIKPYDLQNDVECMSIYNSNIVLFTYEDTVDKVRERLANFRVVYLMSEPIVTEIDYPYEGFMLECFDKATLHLNTNLSGTNTVTYSCSIPSMYGMNNSVENLRVIDDEQDMVQLETAYKLAVLEILTGVNTDDF